MREFVARKNIAHYEDRLKEETEPSKREWLLKLLAEEEAELEQAMNVKGAMMTRNVVS